MFRTFLLLAVLISSSFFVSAQREAVVQEGEFGVGLGAGHYFGDLNTRAHLNRPKIAATAFFRKNFGNYIALRVGASFAQLGYSDIYNTHNEFMQRRNLSFNTNVWELALQGDFNFFRFMPGEPGYNFTPYITFGVSAFNYDPYAFLNGDKYFLRQLGTEGQAIDSLHRKPYSSMAIAFPFGVGIKYSINDRINIGFEVVYRFTNTDYLDDVSTNYADPNSFATLPDGSPSPEYLLQDRSYETGTRIGIKGRQRGNSLQKDAYVMLHFGVSVNLSTYRCPPNK